MFPGRVDIDKQNISALTATAELPKIPSLNTAACTNSASKASAVSISLTGIGRGNVAFNEPGMHQELHHPTDFAG